MTWKEFVFKVEAQLREKGIDGEFVDVGWISWSAIAFGGPVPDVYVQRDQKTGNILIGED